MRRLVGLLALTGCAPTYYAVGPYTTPSLQPTRPVVVMLSPAPEMRPGYAPAYPPIALPPPPPDYGIPYDQLEQEGIQ
jgi:hypothetical protein